MIGKDAQLILWIQNNVRQEKMNKFWNIITFLSDGGWFWIAINIVLLVNMGTRNIGIIAFGGMIIQAIVVNLILKKLTNRPRPFEIDKKIIPIGRIPKDRSFPSGHTSVAFTSALIYLSALPLWFGIITLILASLIAFSRMYLGVHFLTDIIGGILVASIVAIFVI